MHDAVSRAHCILVPAPPQPSLLAEDDDGPIDTDELYLAETEARTIKELHRMQSVDSCCSLQLAESLA